MQNPHLCRIHYRNTPPKIPVRVLLKQIYDMKQLVSYYYAVRVRILGNVPLRRFRLQCGLKTFDVSPPTHPPIYPIFHNIYQ